MGDRRTPFVVGLTALPLLGLGLLLSLVLPPVPRWSVEGNLYFDRFSRDGSLVFFEQVSRESLGGDTDGSLVVADAASGRTVFAVPFAGSCRQAGSADERFLAAGADDRSLRLFDLPARREYRAQLPPGEFTDLQFSPRGTLCFGTFGRFSWGSAFVLEAASGKRLLTLDGSCYYLGATPSEELLFSRTPPGGTPALEIWAAADPPRVRRFPGVEGWRLSPDGRTLLATASPGPAADKETLPVLLFDTASGERRPLWAAGGGPKRAVTYQELFNASYAFTRDGRRLALAPRPGTRLGFWDVATGERVREFPHAFRELTWVSFSPQGERLLTKGRAEESYMALELWDPADGRKLHQEPNQGLKDVYYYFVGDRWVVWHPSAGYADAQVFDARTGTRLGRGRVCYPGADLLVSQTRPYGWPLSWLMKFRPGSPGTYQKWEAIDPRSGVAKFELRTPHPLSQVVFTADGSGVATVEAVPGAAKVLRVWDVPPDRPWGWVVGPPASLGVLLLVVLGRRARRRQQGSPTPAG